MNKQIYRLIKEYTEQHFMHDIINDEVNKNIDVVNDFLYNKDYRPRTKKELKDIIKKVLNDRKYDIEPIDLNFIDVSQITDFSYLFNNMIIKLIDISMWDVANGLRFTGMFSKCDASLFNCNLNDWRINPEADTSFMFVACTLLDPKNYPELTEKQRNALIGDIDYYKPANSKDLKDYITLMLKNNVTDLNFIDVSDIKVFSSLFSMQMHTNFDVSKWDVRKGTKFDEMFWRCKKFNCDLSEWKLEGLEPYSTCKHMFVGCDSLDSESIIKLWKSKYSAAKYIYFG